MHTALIYLPILTGFVIDPRTESQLSLENTINNLIFKICFCCTQIFNYACEKWLLDDFRLFYYLNEFLGFKRNLKTAVTLYLKNMNCYSENYFFFSEKKK